MPLIELENLPKINVVRAGPRAGVPLVFMHPVGLNLSWWSDQFKEFGSERNVVAFDMPGHGLSGDLLERPTFESMTKILRGVLQCVGASHADLVGLSVGGMIAQEFALRYPRQVRSLSLVATLCTFSEPVRSAMRERARIARSEGMARIAKLTVERWFPADFRQRRPDVLDRATNDLIAQDPEFHARAWEMISELELEQKLPALRVPTLIVSGGQDVNAPVAAGRKIAEGIEGAVLVEMPGVGHLPPFEEPQRFNQILREFFARNSAKSSADGASTFWS